MKTVCFSAESLKRSAAMTAGVQPLTSPPITLGTFDPHVLDGADLVFFKLHGLAGQPYWYGDRGITACSAEQLARADLAGALVFAANCWGGPSSPMVQALLAAGATCVVTGEGVNYAGVTRLDGADVIGYVWRRFLQRGFPARQALGLGKLMAKVRRPRLAADIDSFSLVGQGHAWLKEKAHGSQAQV